MTDCWCLAHGLLTLHWRTESGGGSLPAAFTEGAVGEEALALAGARTRRVARWDADGWAAWWALLERIAGGRPTVVAIPALDEAGPIPESFPCAYVLPPSIAVRAAGDAPRGIALYLGAWSWEVAPFDLEATGCPQQHLGGLEPLYRRTIAHVYRQEQRALLPIEVPGYHRRAVLDAAGLLAPILPHLTEATILLGGEDRAVLEAVATELARQGFHPLQADPLVGLERLAKGSGLL
ncbi:MAG: hypothetical protein ACP5SI_12585 [Chloroflexia bacterium]